MRYFTPTALTVLALTGCAATPPAREVRPVPVVTPAPRPSPAQPPLASDWNDWPFTPGNWRYLTRSGSSYASFDGGAQLRLTLTCDQATRQIQLTGMSDGAVTIRTTTLTRTMPTALVAGDPPYAAVTVAGTDPILDAMAFSRGRFVIEQASQPPLVLPPHAEIGRVIEDCRG